MSAIAAVNAWLYTLLSTDATMLSLCDGRAMREPSPPYQTLPLVGYRALPIGRDVRGVGGSRAGTWLTYEVVAIGANGDETAISPIADQIDALLDNTSVALSAFHLRIVRDMPIERTDLIGGPDRYAIIGGAYRIWCAPS